MADLWVPGLTRVNLGLRGGPYDDTRKPKAVWHTTEGNSIAGARRAFAECPPHICYDARHRTGEQYVPLNRHSYSLRGAESDDEYCIQVELVGHAGQTHTWPEERLRNIGVDLIRPLRELVGIPDVVVWHGFVSEAEANRRGFRLATARSPIRLTSGQLREFTGHLAHQHAPPPDEHWDVGGLNITRAIQLSHEEDDMPLSNEDIDRIWSYAIDFRAPSNRNYVESRPAAQALGDTMFRVADLHRSLSDDEVKILTAIRELHTAGVPDVQALASALAAALAPLIPSGVTAEQVQEAVRMVFAGPGQPE
jgi:hypothetical protein